MMSDSQMATIERILNHTCVGQAAKDNVLTAVAGIR